MNEEITNINQLYDGMMITCKISGKYINEARIKLDEYNRVYVCQEHFRGNRISNKFGFKNSWVILTNEDGLLDFINSEVRNFRKHPNSDKLILKKDDKRKT